jgi:hypothetical protein
MNKLAWCAATLVVLGAGAAGLAGTACTVTSSSGDDGGIGSGYDSGNQDVTSQGEDSGQPQADTGTGQDAQSDAGACTAIDTNNANCNSCISTSCNAQMCACTGDTTVDDAGFPQCISDLQCIVDCVAGNPDAGVAPGTATDCESACGGSYSMAENQNAAALFSCLSNSCASQCAMP